MAYANQPGLRQTSFGDAAAAVTDARVKKLTLTPKQAPVAGNAMQQAFSAAEAGGGRMPTTVQAPNWAIDNARPVNPVQYTGGGQVPQPGNWSTAPGAANTGGLRVAGPGLAERQPIRVPPNASMGTAPHAAPATPNLPATIQGQGPTFQGNGAKPNFTMPDASSPYNAQQAKFDADTVQRARDAATRRAAGGGYAGVNQGSGAGVQGGVRGAQPVARPGTIDLRTGGAGEPGRGAYEASKRLGQGRVGQLSKGAGGALARAGTVGGAIANFNDYKLNDPDVDSSAAGTFNALAQGDFSGAGRSLSKGLLETGMDLGSYAANTADIFVPGQPFSQGYNKTLRNHFGAQLTDNSGNSPDVAATLTAPSAPAAPTRPINRMGQAFDDPRRIDRDPSRQSLGASRDFSKELASVPANLPADLRQGVIHKTTDANGRTVYSGMNVGPNAQFVDGMGKEFTPRGSVRTAKAGSMSMADGGYAFTPAEPGQPGQPGQAVAQQAAASLRNPDGSKWSAQDNAIMAANIRDGVDPYRGTSRGAAQMTAGQLYMQQALNAPRTLKNLTAKQMSRIQTQASLIDSQAAERESRAATSKYDTDTRSADNRYQADAPARTKQMELAVTQQMRQMRADIWNRAGGNPQVAAQLAAQAGVDGKDFMDMAKNSQDVDSKARANTQSQLESLFFTDGKDGRVPDKETASKAYEYLNRATGGKFESLPEQERNALIAEAKDRFIMMQGANARRSTGLAERVSLSAVAPAYADLPTDAQLKGGKLERAGLGWDTVVGQPDRLDYRLRAGGHEMYLPQNLSQSQLKYLADRGVQLPK